MTETTETSTDAPLPIDIDAYDDVHEDAVAFVETFHGVIETEDPQIGADVILEESVRQLRQHYGRGS